MNSLIVRRAEREKAVPDRRVRKACISQSESEGAPLNGVNVRDWVALDDGALPVVRGRDSLRRFDTAGTGESYGRASALTPGRPLQALCEACLAEHRTKPWE